MNIREDLTGCRIVIRSATTDEQIADTYIKVCDKIRDIVEIDARALITLESQQIKALVFEKNTLEEFVGSTNNKVRMGRIEIKLSRGVEKNDRVSTRYNVNMMGVCNFVKSPDGTEDAESSFGVTVINMSATGLLVSAPSEHIKPNDVIHIRTRKDGHKTLLTCKVVRKQNTTIQDEEYGCKIVSIETL